MKVVIKINFLSSYQWELKLSHAHVEVRPVTLPSESKIALAWNQFGAKDDTKENDANELGLEAHCQRFRMTARVV